ncbi:RNA-directed DNA polymerase [Sandaracinus amylolyticus]|uniref:RNA-directed DNA polymerase n=1 Tax=Sandaracinus amylolyticus TaxID=927083 RepID=UPI00069E0A83|nr:RNA-directed DNA polymerase [Sandaracinus amylolyticus]
MVNTFSRFATQLDLNAAAVRATRSNDLIPPRPEDSVAGSLGRRFSDGLLARLEGGTFSPSRAYFVPVPKRGFTTRPAAVLTLDDRVVFDATVELLRDRIEQRLNESVWWPRGARSEKRWKEFTSYPLLDGLTTHIVEADITAFYQSVDHVILRDRLAELTGRKDVASALASLLTAVMGAPRGLPQGLDASDPLASAYLTPVDAAAAGAAMRYARNGDDIRVACRSYSQARECLSIIEDALRREHLVLNSSKTRIVTRATYEAEAAALAARRESVRSAIAARRRQALLADHDRLQAELEAAGLDELPWAIWYHHTMTAEEAITALADRLQPTDVDVAEELFAELVVAPVPIDEGLVHQTLVESLRIMTAAQSDAAIPHAAKLLLRYPDKTEIVCRYLLHSARAHPEAVAAAVDTYSKEDLFRTALELAWVLRVASHVGANAGAATHRLAESVMGEEDISWVARVEALRFAATSGALSLAAWQKFWRVAPPAFKPSVIEAAALSEPDHKWPNAVVSVAKQDSALEAIVKRARQQP